MMGTSYEQPAFAELRHELAVLRGGWVWCVVLGAALIVLGALALGSPLIAGLATAVAIGILLIAGGVAETVGACLA